MERGLTLVCFAVKEEAKPFERRMAGREDIQVLVTGMGRRNAENAIRTALERERPGLVLSCGFAGALNPALARGSVVFAAEPESKVAAGLRSAGAQPGRFHCADKVASTSREKRALRESTGADAVEMESQVICSVCRGKAIPSATVRVVLDTVEEDLPLDFNQLMTADERLDGAKLALALVKAPGKIPALVRLQRESGEAAKLLSDVLTAFLSGPR